MGIFGLECYFEVCNLKLVAGDWRTCPSTPKKSSTGNIRFFEPLTFTLHNPEMTPFRLNINGVQDKNDHFSARTKSKAAPLRSRGSTTSYVWSTNCTHVQEEGQYVARRATLAPLHIHSTTYRGARRRDNPQSGVSYLYLTSVSPPASIPEPIQVHAWDKTSREHLSRRMRCAFRMTSRRCGESDPCLDDSQGPLEAGIGSSAGSMAAERKDGEDLKRELTRSARDKVVDTKKKARAKRRFKASGTTFEASLA